MSATRTVFRQASVLLAAFLIGAAAASGAPVTKDKWIESFNGFWPERVCGGIPLECWKATKKACVTEAKASIPPCMKELSRQIPDSMEDPDETSAMGQTVGFCAGKRLGTTLDKKYGRNTASKTCAKMFHDADDRLKKLSGKSR